MPFMNVREPWEMHDTLCVCANLYGSESQSGFFTTWVAFGQQLEHRFFKRRSEGNVHRAYNNQQAEDRSDFVFRAFEVGLLFHAPPTPLIYSANGPAEAQDYISTFWTQDLPRHCSASLKIGQDTNLKLNSMMMSPGYGPATNGAAFGQDWIGVNTVPNDNYWPEMMYTAVQGMPIPQCRYWIAGGSIDHPEPIGIPKGELVELNLKVSEHARGILSTAGGPGNYQMGDAAAGGSIVFASRFSIQASIWGYREVQQRGELRAS